MQTKQVQKPRQRREILQRQLDDEEILFDAQSNTVHVLNATSEFIWKFCDGHHDANGITDELLKRYRVDRSQAERDVKETISRFESLRLIEG